MLKQKGFAAFGLHARGSHKYGHAHIFLLIVIVLVGIAGIGYFAYKNGQVKIPSPNNPLSSATPPVSSIDTSNWKTYKNEAYGFEVKYPPPMYIDDSYPYKSEKGILLKFINSDKRAFLNEDGSYSTVEPTIEISFLGHQNLKERIVSENKYKST